MDNEQSSEGETSFAGMALLLSILTILAVMILSYNLDFSWLTTASRKEPAPAIPLQPYAVAVPLTSPSRDIPSSPARRHESMMGGVGGPHEPAPRGMAGEHTAWREGPRTELPLPKGTFTAAVASGSKVFVPISAGECKVASVSATALVQTLDDCFSAGKDAK